MAARVLTVSISTTMLFYSIVRPTAPITFVRSILVALGAERASIVSRTVEEDRGWDRLLNDDAQVAIEILPDPRTLDDVPLLYLEGRALSIALDDTTSVAMLRDALQRTVPSEVLGDYMLDNVNVTIGFHDLFDATDQDEPRFIARTFLSIRFFGYGTPADCDRFRELVVRLPEVRSLQSSLEEIVGPLSTSVIFSA